MDKQEIKAELLSLRAGLSLISKNTDEMKKAQSVLNDIDEKLSGPRATMKGYRADEKEALFALHEAEDEHALCCECESDPKRRREEHIKFLARESAWNERFAPTKRKIDAEAKEQKFESSAWRWLIPVLYIVLLAVLEGATAEGYLPSFMKNYMGGWGIIGFWVVLLGGVPLVGYLERAKKRHAWIEVEVQKALEEFPPRPIFPSKERRKELDKALVRLRDAAERRTTKREEYEKKLATLEEQSKAPIAQNVAIIKDRKRKNEAIFESLCRQYNNLLRTSDWNQLDLILYYIDSGRADSIKEALLLLDRQKQTDQITYAIHEASGHIQNAVWGAASYMSGALSRSFERLSGQIASCSAANTAALGAMQSELAQQNRLLEKQNTTAELNRALLDKTQANSSMLVESFVQGRRISANY